MDPKKFEIRQAVLADARSVAVLLERMGFEAAKPQVSLRLSAMLMWDAALVLLAVERDTPIGFINATVIPSLTVDKPVGQIAILAVAEEAQGRGAGRALVAAAESWIKKQGATGISVVSAWKRDAGAFWHSMGYKANGTRSFKWIDR